MKAKRIIWALAALGLLLPLAPASAVDGCRLKEQKLEQRLATARAYNNPGQIAGLEKALEEVRRNCTDSGLWAKGDKKVQEKARKVKEREMELEEARAKGNQGKIAKREQKLREARLELAKAQAELAELQGRSTPGK